METIIYLLYLYAACLHFVWYLILAVQISSTAILVPYRLIKRKQIKNAEGA